MRHPWTWPELLLIVLMVAGIGGMARSEWRDLRSATAAAEAVQNLMRIERGAATYYGTVHISKDTKLPLDCQFPGKVGTTPTGASCCDIQNDADNDERCDAKPGNWNVQAWLALKFRIQDQHFDQYSFYSSGTLANAKFTATANGDMDCDGVQSTFQLTGLGDPKASGPACTYKSGGFIFRDHETE